LNINWLQRLSRGAAPRFLVALLPLLPGLVRAQSLPAALERLRADEVLVADEAVEEIVGYGAPAVDSLLVLLDDERRDVRAGAIRGLGLLGDVRAAAPLRERLAASLLRTEPDDLTRRYHRVLLLQAAGRLRDPESAPLLRRAAGSADPFERAHAAISLFLLNADPGYDASVECLADADPAVRNVVVAGLGESERDAARTLLLGAVRDESWIVRDSAYRALARHRGDAEVREAYRTGAEDPSWYVRETVAEFAPE
jgi:HEAT repeat protein